MKPIHSLDVEEIFQSVSTSKDGLTSAEASDRLTKNGKNALQEGKKRSKLAKFFDQLKDVMIIVLIVAAVVSATIAIVQKEYAELIDSGIIMLIVIINAFIGLAQESKAEAALDALKNMNKPFAKVYRDGQLTKIKSEEIVIGDIVVLEAGDIVPADIRLFESVSLKIEEAALTGESVPSEKEAINIDNEEAPLGDRKNMAFSSGVVNYGRGLGVVVAVGMDTEVGKIAKMLNQDEKQVTPLQNQLAKTAKMLSIIVLGVAVIIFVAALLRKTEIINAFMTSVAIAVAAIPEGLPAVVTIVLAIGVQRMSENKAIVRNLPAVETLGCCQIICSDKTGTLTLNQMTVKELFTVEKGNYLESVKDLNDEQKLLIQSMVLCNDTKIGENKLLGDPTETALWQYALDLGYDCKNMTSEFNRVNELPFDSVRKLMTTVNNVNGKNISHTKGAPDMLLMRCKYVLEKGQVRDITDKDREEIKKANSEMANKALRILAVGVKYDGLETQSLEEDLIFVGLVGMIDPPRKEVKEAVKVCKKAGMKAVMITGDHIDTAKAIAKEIGILEDGDWVATGAEIDKIPDEEFNRNILNYRVFARVSPENKVRIVKAFKSQNLIVAMTGDGVNDAPSIKTADIGIGMGITGTDVSKGASDMVLADDNFATIIKAVEEGRKVYNNIKKAVQFLLSANIAEVLCLFVATIFLGVEFLTPVMILWVNLVTDSLPALALGTEKAENDIMNYPPRKTGQSLFAGKTGRDIMIQGFMQTILVMTSFCIGNYVLSDGISNHTVPMTMAFVTLCLIQLLHSFNLRSQTESLFKTNPFSNKFLNLSFIVGLLLLLGAVLIPFIRETIFKTASLNLNEWLISIGTAILIIPMVEIQKLIERRLEKR